jgi:SHAQKYF class myb-like DNA-binding protein
MSDDQSFDQIKKEEEEKVSNNITSVFNSGNNQQKVNNDTRLSRRKKKKYYEDFETANNFFKTKTNKKGFSTGRWSLEEHKKFIQGLFQFGNDWKEIQTLIGTRSCAQARSHAQKFFSKIQRNNLLEIDGIDERLSSVKTLLDYASTLNKKDKEGFIQRLYEIHLDEEENANLQNHSNVANKLLIHKKNEGEN